MSNTVNIVIGVGGTGAKVVESTLALMAAGVGGTIEAIHVGLVDQDESNGNVARTRRLISAIAACRQEWGKMHGANYVDWRGSGADRISLGAIDVRPLFEDSANALWCPERDDETLETILGSNLDRDRKTLFDMLFMPGREEQRLPLGKGYRGRAHVGATAMIAAMLESDSSLMKRLEELLDDPGRRKVNVFIVGSAYGGTGAAGFPTLARALHRLRESREFSNRENVSIGGMLMLPYFSFRDEEGDGEAVVTSDELLPKAQLALNYYDNLFGGERAFDHFYAMGWGSLFHLNYHEAGADEQSNPALPPELFAATAVTDFFQRTAVPGAPGDATRVMVSARNDPVIRWSDLPSNEEIEAKLGQFLRCAVYWRYVVKDLIDAPKGFLSRGNWVHKLSGGQKTADAQAELKALDALIDHVMLWAATIENQARAHWQKGPWSLRHFVVEADSPKAPVELRQAMTETEVLDGFDQLIRIDSGDFVARTSAALHDDLTNGRIEVADESRGLGRVLSTVAKAASLKGA
ncbi:MULTISPECIES: hypothetical protein [unclassified Novosphingobium]|uniref:hypothetical protein n=1 Tax=unclassified Novosphingobium TaxID=2644732 RepID=UPI0013578C38|nr:MULTISPECIES: hypothetical protein [unclassified Novosphingobium]